jgi:hypothetical protein
MVVDHDIRDPIYTACDVLEPHIICTEFPETISYALYGHTTDYTGLVSL